MNDQIKLDLAKFTLTQVNEMLLTSKILGIGSGSTVDALIELLPKQAKNIPVVAASKSSEEQLRAKGFQVLDFNKNACNRIDLYLDGADTFDNNFVLLKGRGKALTREKIIASAADVFVCMATGDKAVASINDVADFPHDRIMIEVIPNLLEFVSYKLDQDFGAQFADNIGRSDNGCDVLEVVNLDLSDPLAIDQQLNSVEGIVQTGIFAHSRPHLIVTQLSSAKDAEMVVMKR